jgi:glycosyltransferase involved in cell wall biosynthesis
MDLWMLYRLVAPSPRAQSIQVVHTAHALAGLGHRVTLAVEPGEGDPLGAYGLTAPPSLRILVNPFRHPGLSGLWYRARFLAWLATAPADQRVVYARSKRYTRFALRFRRLLPFRLLMEVHEVDSVQYGGQFAALEGATLPHADAILANCTGTLSLLRETWPALSGPATVVPNAAAPRAVERCPGPAVGYLGGITEQKGVETLVAAARLLAVPVEIVGGRVGHPDYQRLQEGLPPNVRLRPGVAYHQVPREIAGWRALILPLRDDLFGRRLTSPLKLWEWLGSGIPIVAPDLPTVREVAGEGFLPFIAGDPTSLASAVERALAGGPEVEAVVAAARARRRTWADRARDIEAFCLENVPGWRCA